MAEDFIRSNGGTPEFKGYPGGPGAPDFPGSICASPNDMIVHGIPGSYRLKEGDILSIDVGVRYKGFVTDSATTVAVGEVPEETRGPARDHPGVPAGGHGGRCGPGTISGTSGTPYSPSPKTRATGWSATSSPTG